MKEMFKIDSEKELMTKNDEIVSLKNKIEINQKKMEFQEKKFQNLQYKYLRLLRDKKNEKENLIFSFNENRSSVNLIKNKSNLNKRLNINLSKNILSNPNRLSDEKLDINRIATIFEQSNNNNLNYINNNNEINNIKSINNNIKNNYLNNIKEINVNINNNGEHITIQNSKRHLSPNNDEDKNKINLLPILNNERNLSLKKEPKRKLKLIENLKKKHSIKKSVSKTHNWKELNKIIKTEVNK
jgi:hypothetical protein